MFHSILITGGFQADRLNQFTKLTQLKTRPNPDLLILNSDPSITIKQVRSLENFLQKKPYLSELKTILVTQADKLTLPAQHAILKTLEEPPANSQLFLLSPSEHLLLDTIISRCQVIKLTNQPRLTKNQLKNQLKLFIQIKKSNLAQRISLANNHAKNKDQAIKFVYRLLLFFHSRPQTYSTQLKQTHQTLKQLHANTNPKLTLENFLLNC